MMCVRFFSIFNEYVTICTCSLIMTHYDWFVVFATVKSSEVFQSAAVISKLATISLINYRYAWCVTWIKLINHIVFFGFCFCLTNADITCLHSRTPPNRCIFNHFKSIVTMCWLNIILQCLHCAPTEKQKKIVHKKSCQIIVMDDCFPSRDSSSSNFKSNIGYETWRDW